VKAATSGTPTGAVTFRDGTTTLGTGALSAGKATFATATLAGGTHSLTAVYGGSVSYAGSTSPILAQTVH
jgi:Bacterial Ig-like domain (group 3)